jgi:hypothetical protein
MWRNKKPRSSKAALLAIRTSHMGTEERMVVI